MAELVDWKYMLGGHDQSWIDRETRNGAWITYEIHSSNGTDILREEFSDNPIIRHEMTPMYLPTACNGCRKRFMEDHTLLCPWGEDCTRMV